MKNFGSVAFALALILSPGLLLTPVTAEDSAAAVCATAAAHVKDIQAKAPIEVDSVTNTTGASAQCQDEMLIVTRKIDLEHARMEDDFESFLRTQIADHACADGIERELTKSGWTVRYENTFNDGPVVSITVACE